VKVRFEEEKHDQITTFLRLPIGGIEMLGRSVTLLDEPDVGRRMKHEFGFSRGDPVLAPQLLLEFLDPQDAVYLHTMPTRVGA
jgi:hypothetical protein